MPDYSVFKPISREEWKQGLEESIRLGLAKPGETYEDYLAAAASAAPMAAPSSALPLKTSSCRSCGNSAPN